MFSKYGNNLNKSIIIIAVTVIIALIGMVKIFAAAAPKTCHNCGTTIQWDELKKDGRYYCDYDCWTDEVYFGGEFYGEDDEF